MIKTVCIDSSNKPQEVFSGDWLQKGMEYHITHVFYHPNQGIQGCALREVQLTKRSLPYASFRLSRFAFTQEALQQLIQMIKDCSDLNDFDVMKAIEECDLVINDL